MSPLRTTILALALGTAAAFAPVASPKIARTIVQGDVSYEDVIGADPGPISPGGLMYEDEEGFARRRAVEIKHGRIAMMAFVGMLVQELQVAGSLPTFPGSLTLDGSVTFDSVLADGMGWAALGNVPALGLAQIALFGGIAETIAMPASQYEGGPQNLPGGYDGSQGTIPGGYPFTTQVEDVTARNRALTVELQNGRAAMMGVTGAMMHSMLDSCDHHFFYPITHA